MTLPIPPQNRWTRRREDGDVPDYKPAPLRTWFLTLLFLVICGLLGTLEYLLRVLPHARDRTGIPQDFAHHPAVAGQKRRQDPPPASRQPAGHSRPSATTSKADGLTIAPGPTPPPRLDSRQKQQAAGITARAGAVASPEPRPPDNDFAGTEPIRTYLTVASKWLPTEEFREYGDDWDPTWPRRPIFPGEDIDTGRCVYVHLGVVITRNSTGSCEAIVGWGRDPPPANWTRATWLDDSILFPLGGGCDENYDFWYPFDPNVFTVTTSYFPNLPGPNSFPSPYWNCRHLDGSLVTPYVDLPPHRDYPLRTTPNSGKWARSVLFTYMPARQALVSKSTGLVSFLGDMPVDWSQGVLQERPSRNSSRGVDHTSVTVPSPAAQQTRSGARSASTGAVSSQLTLGQGERVDEVAVTEHMYTTTRYTEDGREVTRTTQFDRTTMALVVVPAVMVAPRLSTQTDSQGRIIATVTDFGGNVVLRTTVTTLTNEQGHATRTVATAVPATSAVVTLTDPTRGTPTATSTFYPVFPRFPGSGPADIIIPRRADYFTVYFLPIILTVLLSIPIHAVDAELKAILPLRLLSRPAGSTEALAMRPPSRLAGLRLLWRCREPLAALGDALVLCVSVLVSLSSETVGLKLRGSCFLQDLQGCFITVAAFEGPARAAEVLLAVAAVLVLVLAVLLARWRSGVATHPGSVAAVCAHLQAPETREVLRNIAVGAYDDDAERQLRDGLKDVAFALGRYAPAPRADDYGLIPLRRAQASPPAGGKGEGRRALTGALHRTRSKVKKSERLLQGAFLFLLSTVLVVVLYYENTVYEDPAETPFEWFMDSQEFGVRMLFTSCGVVISLIWERLFSSTFGPHCTGLQCTILNKTPRRGQESHLPSHGPQAPAGGPLRPRAADDDSFHRPVARGLSPRSPVRHRGWCGCANAVPTTLAI